MKTGLELESKNGLKNSCNMYIYICLYVCMCVWVCVCENCITKRFCKSDLLIKLNNLTDAIGKAIWTVVNYLGFAKAIDSVRNKKFHQKPIKYGITGN